jgi:hypothetical protein
MQAFANEILYTSTERVGVGRSVLAFSIPKAAAAQTYNSGGHMMLATEPDLTTTAFCFLDPGYSQLKQYGPTVVCGDSAVTDVETEDDPSRQFQSSSMRILRMPKRRG